MALSRSQILARRNSALGLCLTLFLVSFHIGIVPAIMPPLVRDLDSSVGYVQGALVLLSLVTASFAPTSENLSRRYGRQAVFHGGLLLFAIATLLVSLSPTMGIFVVSYALLTGIAATPLVSIPWALMDSFYNDKAEKLAFLALSLAMVIGGLLGSLTGGLIAFEYSWRLAFPLELLLIPVIFYLVTIYPPKASQAEIPIDWVGGCFSFLGLGLTLLGVSLAGELGWWTAKKDLYVLNFPLTPFGVSIVPILIASGLIFIGLFGFWQRQRSRQGEISLMRAGLLSRKQFLAGLTVATLHAALMTGLSFNLFQFIPPVLNLNSFKTALTVMPYNLAMIAMLIAMVKFINVSLPPRRIVQAALMLESAGLLWLISQIRLDMTRWSILPALLVIGIGSGLFASQIGTITFSAAQPAERPEARGIYNPFQKVGQALGRGILGTMLVSLASVKIVDGVITELGNSIDPNTRSTAITYLQRAIQTFTKEEMQALWARLPDRVQPALEGIIDASAIAALQTTLWLILAINVFCLALTIRLPNAKRIRN